MELKQYLSIVRRWSWLLIFGLIIGAVGGFLGSQLSNSRVSGFHTFAGDARATANNLRLYLSQ